MGLSGSYEHKDIDSNNNNNNNKYLKGTHRSKNIFDTLQYIVTCMERR